MADISQTNRTILLEQINPEALDLLTLVGDTKGIDSLDDAAVQKINQHLLARTYEEAMDKMNPTAYSFYDAASGTVRYTLARPEGIPEHLLTVIPLRGNDVLRMLITVLDAKSASGSANIKFDYESFTQMISPKKVLDDIRQMRKELQISYSEFQALPTGDPRRDEYAAKLNSLFQSARDNYSNTMALLPLAIEDSRQRLLGAGDGNGEKHEKISAGVARFEKDGTLKILAAPTSQETALVLAENASGKELAGLLAEDYAATTQETASEYVSELVVRTFSPLANSLETPADRKKEAENYNNYLKLYTDSKAAFVKMVKPLMEKLLGIYAFFSQYPVQSKTGMRPALLIANNTPEMLAKSNNLPRLRTFLNTTNNKNEYTDSLWFAIFPNVSLDRAADVKPTRQVFAVSEENQRRDTYSINVLTQLLSALSAYQVKTFFSFETGEKTTFDRVAREGVAVFLDHSEPLTNKDFSAFAVPCLPNFTVVPQYRSGVITGETLDISGKDITVNDDPDQLARFWLEGVYIPASFVAAGITAACQCPEYLAQCFRRGV
ncbi:MAG: transcriptional regulator, partial [Gracilibacteraceae bacterium]|nr:transcriptional regulator [Gracilibacteraceae bacterium]